MTDTHETGYEWLRHTQSGRVCCFRLATFQTNRKPVFRPQEEAPIFAICVVVHYAGRPSPDVTERVGHDTYASVEAAADAMMQIDLLNTEWALRALDDGWETLNA